MEAKEFIRKFGWEYARHVKRDPLEYSHYLGDTPYQDLKTLVDAYELVYFFGNNTSYAKGFLEELVTNNESAFYHGDDLRSYSVDELAKAIKLVESVDEND